MSVIILSSHATHLDCRLGTHIYTLSAYLHKLVSIMILAVITHLDCRHKAGNTHSQQPLLLWTHTAVATDFYIQEDTVV